MPYGTVNADVIQSSVANTSLGAGNASIMKNRIINGAMVIDQRNAGASVTATSNPYTLDRYQALSAQAAKYTVQQNAGSVTTPSGFTNYLGCTSSSAYSVLSTDFFSIQQSIEGFNVADLGWGGASAKTVTLSFQVYSSLTGTFGGSLRNSDLSRSYPFSYSIPVANTWTTISVTIAGDTTGTWVTNNGIGIKVGFCLGAGSTYSGTAGSWSANNYFSATGATSVVGTSGATFYITGVQLEVGSSATGYEYRQYGTELSLCQRYCQVLGGNLYVTGMAFSTNRVLGGMPYINCMRAAPTVTIASNGYTFFTAGAAQTSSAVSAGANANSSTISLDVTVTATTGVPGVGQTTATTVSAEL